MTYIITPNGYKDTVQYKQTDRAYHIVGRDTRLRYAYKRYMYRLTKRLSILFRKKKYLFDYDILTACISSPTP